MVAGFNRSFSLPGSPRILKTRPASSDKSYHVRSISLPGRSHPLISQLEDDIRSVNSWLQYRQQHPSSQPDSEASWICDGLARLEILHVSLTDLLNLPQNQDSLRRCGSLGSDFTDRILDDSLRFADVHGSFRSELLVMNELQSEAQVAIRRNDGIQLASCIKSMKKSEKQIVKLASSIQDASKSSPSITTRFNRGIEEAELAGIVREVMHVTVSASAAMFLVMAAVLSSNYADVAALSTAKINSWTSLKKLSPSRSNLKKMVDGGEGEKDSRRNVLESLERREKCIGAVEKRSERLFRSLVNTRVSLLNILSSH